MLNYLLSKHNIFDTDSLNSVLPFPSLINLVKRQSFSNQVWLIRNLDRVSCNFEVFFHCFWFIIIIAGYLWRELYQLTVSFHVETISKLYNSVKNVIAGSAPEIQASSSTTDASLAFFKSSNASSSVGGKASLQPKRTPVSKEEIEAILVCKISLQGHSYLHIALNKMNFGLLERLDSYLVHHLHELLLKSGTN